MFLCFLCSSTFGFDCNLLRLPITSLFARKPNILIEVFLPSILKLIAIYLRKILNTLMLNSKECLKLRHELETLLFCYPCFHSHNMNLDCITFLKGLTFCLALWSTSLTFHSVVITKAVCLIPWFDSKKEYSPLPKDFWKFCFTLTHTWIRILLILNWRFFFTPITVITLSYRVCSPFSVPYYFFSITIWSMWFGP